MSYTKQTWTTGDTVTASKLNHMEDGIAGAGSGFDVVIKADKWFSDPSLAGTDLHLIKGDYASIIAKATAGDPISTYAYAVFTNTEDENVLFTATGVGNFINLTQGIIGFEVNYEGSTINLGLDSNDDLYID